MKSIIWSGDCLRLMKELDSDSVDAVVTDPPYGLSFMGNAWDYKVPSTEVWAEVLRVMKPGAHLLAFSGSRTYHRMVVRIEDAGFEIRDQLMWIYGQGFPKSLNISKAIDKHHGADRPKVLVPKQGKKMATTKNIYMGMTAVRDISQAASAASAASAAWDGWGTALKPAHEPIVLAQKPIVAKTVAANVLRFGTGALNIDSARIGEEQTVTVRSGNSGAHGRFGKDDRKLERLNPPRRFPSNVLLDEKAAELVDQQSGTLKTARGPTKRAGMGFKGDDGNVDHAPREANQGGASRFFYVAKASRSEKEIGTEELSPTHRQRPHGDGLGSAPRVDGKRPTAARNFHPTVKPEALMRYLCRLITPKGGLVMDPFTGSGSTAVAAIREGFQFKGMELDLEYVKIARARLAAALREA